MATSQLAKQLQALCYEHHVRMEMAEIVSPTNGSVPHKWAYACPKPDCGVHYSAANGYFAAAGNGQAEPEIMPRVKCSRDGQPMYLAETNPQKKAFRLWRCPQCNGSRTNEEGLVSDFAMQEQG